MERRGGIYWRGRSVWAQTERLRSNKNNIAAQDARLRELRAKYADVRTNPISESRGGDTESSQRLEKLLQIAAAPPSLQGDGDEPGERSALKKRLLAGLSIAVSSVNEVSKGIMTPFEKDADAKDELYPQHGDIEVTVVLPRKYSNDFEVCTVNLDAFTTFRDVMIKVMSYWSLDPEGHALVDPNGYCWPLDAKVVPTLRSYQTQFQDSNNLIRVHRDDFVKQREGQYVSRDIDEKSASKDKNSTVNEIINARNIELHQVAGAEDGGGDTDLNGGVVHIEDDVIPGLRPHEDGEDNVKAALNATKKEHEWLYQIRKRNKMRNPMWPRVHCEMFVLFLMAACYFNAVIFRRRVSSTFQFKNSINSRLVYPRAQPEGMVPVPSIVDVDSKGDFYVWMDEVIGISLTSPASQANDTTNHTSIDLGSQTFLLGSVRMKQMRHETADCSSVLSNIPEFEKGCVQSSSSTTSERTPSGTMMSPH